MLVVRRASPERHRYFLVGGAEPGRWIGRATAVLGCPDHITGVALGRLLAGQHPLDGSQLSRRRSNRLAGLELVLAAPKSASLVAGLGPPTVVASVRRAHDAAVDAALSYLEAHACVVRDGPSVRAAGQGLLGAAFQHRVSRAHDPHLHSHVLVANLALGPSGRWRALHTPIVFAELRAAGAVYDAVLRHETTQLGLRWVRRPDGGLEVAGVSRSVIDAFSRRHAQVLERVAADEAGAAGGRTPAGAVRLTRPDRVAPPDGLVEEWRRRAASVGFQLPPMLRPNGTVAPPPPPSFRPAQIVADIERDRFGRSDAVQRVATAAGDGASLEDIERVTTSMLRSAAVVPLAQPRPSGPGIRDGPEGPAPRYQAAATVELADRLVSEAAARGVTALVAERGADRDDVLANAARWAWARGELVVAAAPSPAAARDLEAATGIPAAVPPLVVAEVSRRRSAGLTIVVADAERMSTPQLSALLGAARSADAHVVLAGDERGAAVTFSRMATRVPRIGVELTPAGDDVFKVAVPSGTLTVAVSPAAARDALARDRGADDGGECFVLGARVLRQAPEGPVHRYVVAPAGPVPIRVHGLGMAAELSGPAWVLDRLGPRPQMPLARQVWRAAVGEVVVYRQRWNVGDSRRALGPAGVDVEASGERRALEERLARVRLELGPGRDLNRSRGLER